MSSVACDWDAMCTLFLKNGDRFELAVLPNSSEVEIFRTVYENGYVRTLVAQWLAALPAREPAAEHGDSNEGVSDIGPANAGEPQQVDVIDLTRELRSDTLGRYVVVADNAADIATDAPVISESAFALVPVYPASKPQQQQQQPLPLKCSNCADWRTLEALRCAHCQRVSFCSPACRDAVPATVHRAECRGHRMGLFAALGVSHLAVQTLLLGTGQLAAVLDGVEQPAAGDLVEWWLQLRLAADQKATQFSYARVLRLMTNFAKSSADDLLRYALTAVMLTMYLKEHSEFFAPQSQFSSLAATPADAEIAAGTLILAHMGQIINNAHTICALIVRSPTDAVTPAAQSDIPLGHLHDRLHLDVVATALYPRIALLNHSCTPNIRNRFDGRRLTVSATRPLAAGAEVFNCYVSTDAQQTTDERRAVLGAQYGFECECSRCTADGEPLDTDTYVCACGGRIVAQSQQSLWWRHADRPAESLRCPKCECTVEPEWYDRFMMMFEREATAAGQRKLLAADTCRLYAEVTEVLEVGHRLRGDMAAMVVRLWPLAELALDTNDAELIELLMPVAFDYALAAKRQFHGDSLEHLEAAHVWLDLQALRLHLFGVPVTVDYAVELRATIAKVASAQAQPIYAKYFTEYLLSAVTPQQ